MKRGKWIPMGMLVLTLALPVSLGLTAALGWQLLIHHPLPLSIGITVVFCGLCVGLLCRKEAFGKQISGLVLWLPLLCVINLFIVMFLCRDVRVMLFPVIRLVFAVILLIRSSKSLGLRILSAVLSGGLLVLFLVWALFWFTFGQIGSRNVVQQLDSPEGTHRAELVDVNQGALGGSTLVEVYEQDAGLNLCFFEIRKKPERVYMGPWGAYRDMQIRWQDENTLIINDTAYPIP